MTEGFERKVNPNAIRKPTEDEMSQKTFYDEPHIEKLYYINLQSSVSRRKHMEQMLANVKFPHARWPAITKKEAAEISKTRVSEFTDEGMNKISHGTAGCYFSHHTLLQNISKEEDPNAVFIIMEDDIGLTAKILEEVECQLKMLPPEWDLFKFGYMGYHLSHVRKGSPPPARKPYKYPECPGDQINKYTCHEADYNANYMGAQAYAVRPTGAATIIQHLRNKPIMDIDGAMMVIGGESPVEWDNAWQQEHKGHVPKWINTYVSKRNMVNHENFGGSTRLYQNGELIHEDIDGGRHTLPS